MTLIRTMCALIGAVCAGAMLPSSAAAAWPERPITLLHGFGAGGNGDLTARVVAERLSARLGQSVVVEPKPGAGGRVAAGFVAKASADGYTLLLLPGGHAASAAMQQQMNYHPIDDFTFIGATVFTGPGQVMYAVLGTSTYVWANVDGTTTSVSLLRMVSSTKLSLESPLVRSSLPSRHAKSRGVAESKSAV